MRLLARTFVMSAAVAVSLGASAEPSDVVTYRQAVMKANGGHMAAATAIVQGKVGYKEQLADHARALEAINKNITALFPKGSEKESDAREEIWTNFKEFEQRAKDAREKAAMFAKAVASNDPQQSTRLRELGNTCKGCHRDFRND